MRVVNLNFYVSGPYCKLFYLENAVRTGTIGFITNVVWACTFGAALFLFYIIAGVLNCITIIGIPFGLQSFKLAGISFWPVGRRVVSVELAKAARKANAENQLSALRQTGNKNE